MRFSGVFMDADLSALSFVETSSSHIDVTTLQE